MKAPEPETVCQAERANPQARLRPTSGTYEFHEYRSLSLSKCLEGEKETTLPGSDGECVAKEPFLDGERASSKPEHENSLGNCSLR